MKKKVIIAGHICVDITPVFSAEQKYESLDKILLPGKLINVGAADIHTGGCVSNTGLALKILGTDVKLIAKIGNDEFGNTVSTILSRYGVDSLLLSDDESSTSYSIILAIPGIDRIFLHNQGANDTFCNIDIPDKAFEGASLFHFGYPTLMQKIFLDNGNELVGIFKRAKDKGLATSLDLASVDPNSRAGKIDWIQYLNNVLPYTDIFLPSFEEICFMLERLRYNDLINNANGRDLTEIIDIETDVVPLADKLLKLGAKIVVIKCGVRGMLLKTSSEEKLKLIQKPLSLNTSKWCDKIIFEKSYKVEKVLSGTGAGDTSIAAFLAALISDETPKNAMHLATAAGACCVQTYDAVSGLMPLAKLKQKIKSGWEKYGEK